MDKPNHCEPVVGNATPRAELLAKINTVTAGSRRKDGRGGAVMSVKSMVRKAALKTVGCVEIPYGGTVGMSPEQERAAALQWRGLPLWFPNDPRHSHLYAMRRDGDREATPEEAAFYLELDKEHLGRAGLTLAEPGDPDGFLVKWKGRERDRERLKSLPAVREVVHG